MRRFGKAAPPEGEGDIAPAKGIQRRPCPEKGTLKRGFSTTLVVAHGLARAPPARVATCPSRAGQGCLARSGRRRSGAGWLRPIRCSFVFVGKAGAKAAGLTLLYTSNTNGLNS
jgi:hypothetical protein